MKGQSVIIVFVVALLSIAGFAAYVRLAPSDPARWNIDLAGAYAWQNAGLNKVKALTNGAVLRRPASPDMLARLDAIAMATPRTNRLAGSVEQGRITWVTRSALWGFPDYTTAQIQEDSILLYARSRFGKSDLGVNAKRLEQWQSKL
jgi:hypothetical protein